MSERPSETATVLWAYAVVPGDADTPEGLTGLDGQGVRLVRSDGLALAVSDAPRAAYDEDGLRRHLEDLPWLEASARAHDGVVASLAEGSPVLPLRLCTVYADELSAREMLAGERGRLTAALDRIRGRVELGVTVVAGPGADLGDDADARASGAVLGGAAASSSGSAYLARKLRHRDAKAAASRRLGEVAARVHESLTRYADAGLTRPPQPPEVAGYEGTMALNAAYLVRADAADEFTRAAHRLTAEYGPRGVTVRVSGPWAPYSFAEEPRRD